MVRLSGWLATASGALGGMAVVLMIILINLDVLGANLFQKPLKGTMEIVSYIFDGCCLVSADDAG